MRRRAGRTSGDRWRTRRDHDRGAVAPAHRVDRDAAERPVVRRPSESSSRSVRGATRRSEIVRVVVGEVEVGESRLHQARCERGWREERVARPGRRACRRGRCGGRSRLGGEGVGVRCASLGPTCRMPLSPSTPSKLPTTKSAWRSGRAASSSPRPSDGGTPSGSVRVPRLMSPTKVRLTDPSGGRGGSGFAIGIGAAGVGGGVLSRAGRGPSGGGALAQAPSPTSATISAARGVTPGPGRPRSWPPRASGRGSAPDPPLRAARSPAPTRWIPSGPPGPAAWRPPA